MSQVVNGTHEDMKANSILLFTYALEEDVTTSTGEERIWRQGSSWSCKCQAK